MRDKEKSLANVRFLFVDNLRFNKRPEDFKDKDAYDNYLEEIEDISNVLLFLFLLVYSLIENTDIAAVEEKIEQYRQENQELIQKNIQKEVNHHLLKTSLFRQMKTCLIVNSFRTRHLNLRKRLSKI
jgi:hypothetical protein